MHAGARVAILHISPNDVLAPREDTVVCVGIETYDLVLIDIGEVHGHMLVDKVDLLQGHLSRSDLKELPWGGPS